MSLKILLSDPEVGQRGTALWTVVDTARKLRAAIRAIHLLFLIGLLLGAGQAEFALRGA